MANPDVRWHQRFQNFVMALSQLEMAGQLAQTRQLSELEKQGLIQAFEFTHELAWNVLKDYFEYQGNPSITGSRDASREAFQNGLVSKGEVWMEMIKSRNKTSHTYNRKIAEEIVEKILTDYISAFGEFKDKMNVYLGQK
jgi:nucleotidyltransferase substrate binding protein (TIGR01987 family)